VAITFNSYAPFDSGAGANTMEAGWQAMQRRTGAPGVIRGSLNELLCFGDSTGRQVKVMSGEVWAEGFWGATTSTNTLAIAANASGNTRKDLVVWRINVTTNLIELDVVTGTPSATPVVPALTRNSSIYESPIAVVTVVTGAVTIASADVLDVRWWGGPTTPTLIDDYTMFGDAVSSTPRNLASTSTAATSGITYLALTQCTRDVRVANVRSYVHSARVGGFRDLRILTGYSRHEVTDVTGNISPTDTSVGYKVDALPSPLYITAGQFVCFAYLCTTVTTPPAFSTCVTANYDTGASALNHLSEILNPSPTTLDPLGRWSSVFLSGQTTINTTIRVHQEGTWSKRAGSFWFALGPAVN
jgi:hypothetical protein